MATGRSELLTETERRQEYLNKMTALTRGCTKLEQLVVSCLADKKKRPKIADVSKKVEDLKALHCKQTVRYAIDPQLSLKIEVDKPVQVCKSKFLNAMHYKFSVTKNLCNEV